MQITQNYSQYRDTNVIIHNPKDSKVTALSLTDRYKAPLNSWPATRAVN